jgi:predicted  nucleic acid-binding Zn-ribbon protein
MNPYEWRIEEIERNAKRAVDSLWKLDALSGRVDSLESALRESRSEADGLRSELQTCQETLRRLEEQMVEMANRLLSESHEIPKP